MLRRSSIVVVALAGIAALAQVVPADFGADPMAALELGDPGAGATPEHRLRFFAAAGELETYTAIVEYPPGFEFLGLTQIGPLNSTVGLYELDFNGDGEADVAFDVRSRGNGSAYVDSIEDGTYSPGLEPTLSASPPARFGVRFPFGGDALSTTTTVPFDATATLVLFAGVLRSPAAGGSYEVVAQVVSVDPDTDGPDDGVDPGPERFEVHLPVEIAADQAVSFERLKITDARVKLQKRRLDWFWVRGRLELGDGSDGIDPLAEGVAVGFGPFSELVEGSTLHRIGHAWIHVSRDGVGLLYLDRWGSFLLSAHGVDLSGLDPRQPVPFSLEIGDDVGEVEIPFDARGRHDPPHPHPGPHHGGWR